MSQPKAKRVAVVDRELHVEIDLGERVACPLIAEIGPAPVSTLRTNGSEIADFATGMLCVWRGSDHTRAGSLVFGKGAESLSIALDAMQVRTLWRSLTGGPIPAPQHVCPEHHEVMAEESPGRPVCVKCIAAAKEQEVVA